MSIIAYPLEATEYTAEDVQSYLSTRASGVYSEDITFTPEGMTVTVSPFLAWFNYAKFKGCSVAVTEPETLTFSPAHAVLDRIDRIALRVDFTLNRAYFTIIAGVPSSNPSPPEISKTEVINDISPVYVRIRAGATEITLADITSTILDENVCGIMRDGVTGIPTSQLQKQVEELLNRLQEAINGVESGSAFMMSDLYDPQKKAKPVAFDDEVLKKTGGSFVSSLIDESAQLAAGYKSIYPTGAHYKDINEVKLPNDTRVFTTRVIRGADYNEVTFGLSNSQNASPSGLTVKRTEANVYSALIAANKQLFGEHNKPTGNYTGNDATSRSVSIGGLGILFLFNTSNKIWGFVTSKGFFYTANPGGNAQSNFTTSVTFNNGVLSINNTAILNQSGQTYYYQVL